MSLGGRWTPDTVAFNYIMDNFAVNTDDWAANGFPEHARQDNKASRCGPPITMETTTAKLFLFLAWELPVSISCPWMSTSQSRQVSCWRDTAGWGSNYSPGDIVEAELGCYKIDLLFQWVGNQRGTFMLVDSIGLLECRGVGKKKTESLAGPIELLSQIERGIEAESANNWKHHFSFTWKSKVGFIFTF